MRLRDLNWKSPLSRGPDFFLECAKKAEIKKRGIIYPYPDRRLEIPVLFGVLKHFGRHLEHSSTIRYGVFRSSYILFATCAPHTHTRTRTLHILNFLEFSAK